MSNLEMPLSVRIEEWRKKALNNELTPEEAREAIIAIRQGRLSAATASNTSRAKKAATIIDSDKLLDDLL